MIVPRRDQQICAPSIKYNKINRYFSHPLKTSPPAHPCTIHFQHSVYTGFSWLFKRDKLTLFMSSKFDLGRSTIISLRSTGGYLQNLSEQCKPRPTQKKKFDFNFFPVPTKTHAFLCNYPSRQFACKTEVHSHCPPPTTPIVSLDLWDPARDVIWVASVPKDWLDPYHPNSCMPLGYGCSRGVLRRDSGWWGKPLSLRKPQKWIFQVHLLSSS